MSQTPSQDKVGENLKKIFHNPTIESSIVDLVVRSKPAGWGRRSVAPYFKHKYGMQVKSILDEMMVDKEPRLFDYVEFKQKYGQSAQTLYMRINQSVRYVMEMMDTPDKKYSEFCERILIRRAKTGIVIEVDPNLTLDGDPDTLSAKKIHAKNDVPRWKEDLRAYIETANPGDKPYFQERLALSPTEIEDLRVELGMVKDSFISSVTAFSVKVIPVNAEAVKNL